MVKTIAVKVDEMEWKAYRENRPDVFGWGFNQEEAIWDLWYVVSPDFDGSLDGEGTPVGPVIGGNMLERAEIFENNRARYHPETPISHDLCPFKKHVCRHPPRMSLRDQEYWDLATSNCQEGSAGRAVIEFAEKWALLMEERIAGGDTISKCAQEAFERADRKVGMSGFGEHLAVCLLSKAWVHGEEFRRWYNVSRQRGNEGEVANENGAVLNTALPKFRSTS